MSYKPKYDKSHFDQLVKKNFHFLEVDAEMDRGRVRSSGGTDPRDAALLIRYSGQTFRLDVGLREFEKLFAISIKFHIEDLSNAERYALFEPFAEYLSGNKEKAIVPYITEGMSIKRIEAVMEQRQAVFRDGLPAVMEEVGKKLQAYLGQLQTASADQLRGYHQWMMSKC